jgi:aminoglycoside phosphotransferase (APT) family kinase protein
LLDVISSHFVFAPRPLLVDPDGSLLGDPVIVLSWFEGSPAPPPRTGHPSLRSRWIADFVAPLVAIHTIGPDELPAGFRRAESPAAELMNVAREAGTDALSRRLLGALHRSLPAESDAAPVLLHHDYWYGNTIWQDGRLTGVVDWSSARLGDPRNDLALARTDLAVTLDLNAPDELVTCYERIRGPVSGLLFWDLLWALVAHRHMDDWLIGYHELGLPELSSEEAKSKIADFAERALRGEAEVHRNSGR